MTRTTRRDLLGAAGFTALAGVAAVSIARPDAQAVEVAPVVAHPDAELIAECAAFDVLERRYRATFDGVQTNEEWNAGDAERDRIHDQQELHYERITTMEAKTLEGLRAKARTAALENPELLKEDQGSRGGNLMLSIISDLIGEPI